MPDGVVGFRRDEGDVERIGLRDLLHLGQVQGLHFDREAFGFRHAFEAEPLGAHLLDVFRPKVDDGDVVAVAGEIAADMPT